MSQNAELDQELERRLAEIETAEADDPVHAVLSGRTITLFVTVVVAIAGVSWVVAAL